MSIIKPINDKILIRREEPDEKKNGIYIAQTNPKKKCRGEVLAVGEGVLLPDGTRKPVCVQPGQVVVFQPGIGTEITHEGETYLIIEERDLLVVLGADDED